MNLFRLFSIGADAILRKGCSVPGTVIKVSRCWWLKINTKPIRRYSGDGAVYPHIITFEYQVNGITYQGQLYIPVRYLVPQAGTAIAVYYDPDKPQRYACHAFGLSDIN